MVKDDRKICVGLIAGAHGVKGLVRLRSFTEEPEAIADYPLSDEDGKRSFKVTLKGVAKDCFVAAVKGVGTREGAEALRGTRLYVTRADLPKTRKGEYYQTDLVGLAALDKNGARLGAVLAVHDYGAGAFLEIAPPKGASFMLPLTAAYVPEVDLKSGRITIALPEGWLS